MQEGTVAFERRELAPDRVAAEGRDESAASRRVVALVAAGRPGAQLPLRIGERAAFCCRRYEEQRGARRAPGESVPPPRLFGRRVSRPPPAPPRDTLATTRAPQPVANSRGRPAPAGGHSLWSSHEFSRVFPDCHEAVTWVLYGRPAMAGEA